MHVRVSYTVESVRTHKGTKKVVLSDPNREQFAIELGVVAATKGIRLNNESRPDWSTIKPGDVLSFMSSIS
jgi:hypothetical protein